MDNLKTQIADSLKKANNVLVTVSNDPSVDQLSAAIGLTLLLNKLGKHSTAVFSGAVPSILEFLEPEKTLERTTDSLRDFIIALDKSKADKLRYKVEDKLVKIFITPYRTSIDQKDLQFSQGDFNVDAVVALGVKRREELDQAITAHGRILHDATIISINLDTGSDVGTMNLVDAQSSSLCETVVFISGLISNKPDLLDAQMATAFLTGIVAETDRFRNSKTGAATMNISGKLMSAGANQQLVADKLEPVSLHNNQGVVAGKPSIAVSGEEGNSVKIDHDQKLPDNNGKIDHGNNVTSTPIQGMPALAPQPLAEPLPRGPAPLPMAPPRGAIPQVQPRPTANPYLVRPLPWQDQIQATTNPAPDNLSQPSEATAGMAQSRLPMLSHNQPGADMTTANMFTTQAPDGSTIPVAPGGTPAIDPDAVPPTLAELEQFVKSPHQQSKPAKTNSDAVSPVIPTPFVYVANSSIKPTDYPAPTNVAPPQAPQQNVPTAPFIPPAGQTIMPDAANQPPLPPIDALNANPLNLDLGHDGEAITTEEKPAEPELPSMTVDSSGVPQFNAPEEPEKPIDQSDEPPTPNSPIGPPGAPPPVPPPMMPPSANSATNPDPGDLKPFAPPIL